MCGTPQFVHFKYNKKDEIFRRSQKFRETEETMTTAMIIWRCLYHNVWAQKKALTESTKKAEHICYICYSDHNSPTISCTVIWLDLIKVTCFRTLFYYSLRSTPCTNSICLCVYDGHMTARPIHEYWKHHDQPGWVFNFHTDATCGSR